MSAPDSLSAREYHERTKHSPESIRADDFRLDWENKPLPWKVYEDLPTRPLADAIRPPPVPALRAIAEPRADPRPAEETGAPAAPDLDALTQLCYLSAGVTKRVRRGDRDLLFRAAACTGALYHVDLYVVCGAVAGTDAAAAGVGQAGDAVDPGVYHFDPRTLSLDVLREGDYRGTLADAAGGYDAVADAPVTFVATSTWWRNAWKYRERTYRHAFWDSGTVVANLLAAAHALDLPAEVVTGFADGRVADLLGVDPAREAPLELVPVGTGEARRASDSPSGRSPRDGASPPDSREIDPIDPVTRPLSDREIEYGAIPAAYRASTLADSVSGSATTGGSADERGESASEAVQAWRANASGGDGVGTRPSGDGERVALAPVGDDRAAKTPLYRTVRRRGSCREYERDDLNFRKVSTVLDRAFRGVPTDVRDPDAPPLRYNDCYLLVNGVAGVEPGAYHYHPADGELERLRAGECRAEAGHLALDQRLAADAALCAYFLTDLDDVTDRLGDRGYRVAQLEAAVTAGRLYLAAYAHRDLGATGLTFYDDEVTEFLSPRAAGQTPTFLWTLGRPA